jgi:hypothetical protein
VVPFSLVTITSSRVRGHHPNEVTLRRHSCSLSRLLAQRVKRQFGIPDTRCCEPAGTPSCWRADLAGQPGPNRVMAPSEQATTHSPQARQASAFGV